MTPKTKLAMALAAAMITTGAAQASHNNPWAGEDDVVLEQFHDANQEKSVGTSGQDEMRGVPQRPWQAWRDGSWSGGTRRQRPQTLTPDLWQIRMGRALRGPFPFAQTV
jgi:hypothetical protein